MDEVNICPECRQEKHRNCDGAAWDNIKDEPTTCECSSSGHNLS